MIRSVKPAANSGKIINILPLLEVKTRVLNCLRQKTDGYLGFQTGSRFILKGKELFLPRELKKTPVHLKVAGADPQDQSLIFFRLDQAGRPVRPSAQFKVVPAEGGNYEFIKQDLSFFFRLEDGREIVPHNLGSKDFIFWANYSQKDYAGIALSLPDSLYWDAAEAGRRGFRVRFCTLRRRQETTGPSGKTNFKLPRQAVMKWPATIFEFQPVELAPDRRGIRFWVCGADKRRRFPIKDISLSSSGSIPPFGLDPAPSSQMLNYDLLWLLWSMYLEDSPEDEAPDAYVLLPGAFCGPGHKLRLSLKSAGKAAGIAAGTAGKIGSGSSSIYFGRYRGEIFIGRELFKKRPAEKGLVLWKKVRDIFCPARAVKIYSRQDFFLPLQKTSKTDLAGLAEELSSLAGALKEEEIKSLEKKAALLKKETSGRYGLTCFDGILADLHTVLWQFSKGNIVEAIVNSLAGWRRAKENRNWPAGNIFENMFYLLATRLTKEMYLQWKEKIDNWPRRYEPLTATVFDVWNDLFLEPVRTILEEYKKYGFQNSRADESLKDLADLLEKARQRLR